MNFFARVKRGFLMGFIAYEFIMKNKKVLLFTVVSTLLVTLTLFTFIGVLLVKTGLAEAIQNSILHKHVLIKVNHKLPNTILGLLLFVVLTVFFSVFFNVGLADYVGNVIENKPAGFFSSMGRAFSRFFVILQWVIISWIVGSIASAIRDQKGIIGRIIGSLIAGLLTLAWSILTFFVIPIIANEDLGIIATIELSCESMKKTFGQNVGATFALQTANFILGFAVSLFFWLLAFILWSFFGESLLHSGAQGAFILTVSGLTAIGLPIILVTPITSAAGTIFRVASYNYANGKPTGPFSPQMIKESFVTKVVS